MKNHHSWQIPQSLGLALLFLMPIAKPSNAVKIYIGQKKPSSYAHDAVPLENTVALSSQPDEPLEPSVDLGENPLPNATVFSIPVLNPIVVAERQGTSPWLKGAKLEKSRLKDYVLSFTATGHGALTLTFLDAKGRKVQNPKPITWLRDNQAIRFTVRLDELTGDR